MKTKCIMIVALTVGLSAFNMAAQPNERPEGPGPGPREGGPDGRRHEVHRKIMVPPIVVALDANKDGTISADELANASTAIKALDKNNDGAIQMEELRPPRPERPGAGSEGERRGPPSGERPERPDRPERPRPPVGPGPDGVRKEFHLPPPPVITSLDANGDKTISADEIANASNALKALDKNGDGALQKEEMRPELPPPHGDK